MSCFIKSFATSLLTVCLFASPLVLASAERLEVDLAELFAEGELRIGEVNDASSGAQMVAEDTVFEGQDGQRIPVERYSPVDVLSDRVTLDCATLLGGEAALTLDDHGLLTRFVTLAATLEGVTEEQILEVARTQAQGYGMVFGS